MSNYTPPVSDVSSENSDISPSMKKDLKKVDAMDYSSLEEQCQAEISIAYDHQSAKKQEILTRLKLYNNQKRDKDAAGDTTMFTIFQTVLASLYADKLMASWVGREEGDDEVAENLDALSEFDYEQMEKDQIDFDWDWDTLFGGRGLCELEEYIRDPKKNIYLPIPKVIDFTTFLRDPRATSVNGNTWTGDGAARFYGYPIRMTRDAMKADPSFLNSLDFRSIKYDQSMKSLLEQTAQARNEAQGNNNTDRFRGESKLGDNAEYTLMKWNTRWKINGELKKCRVFLANGGKKIVGFKELGDPSKKWGLIDRVLYPTSHDWDGTSIPDLTEDKQRMRAVAQNLGIKAMTADLYPNYIYDQQKIKNRGYLKKGFNHMIPVDGDPNTAIAPQRNAAPNMVLLEFIYNTLDMSAQKATATPDIKQGIQSQANRPLGETNLIASQTDTRYSLSAKIFGWSDRRFWLQYYTLYKDNFEPDIDKKVLWLVGAFGGKWRPLERKNIIADVDPDVQIESTNVSRAKQMEDRALLKDYFQTALMYPGANQRWGLKKWGKLIGMKKDELDRLYPPTIDEMQAEDENVLLNKNKPVQVLDGQDHVAHLDIHAKANPTKATIAHIETTKHMMMIQKQKAIAQAQKQQQPGTPGQSAQPTGIAGSSTAPQIGQPPAMGAPAGSPSSSGVAPSQTSNSPAPVGA